ncbi:hypothetical protein Cabys_47 [Caldithrix abyssi DSM 13497]|uniref:Uncharacterized protein n=1 Tax=Caldithrix abyssi DSM 13497 TaxID=880073 RepID=A0A1J1C2L2_CALAY|nr:hypothetical protein Cabys_47 [Caldithrix abyssi DSM 13497]
MRKVIFTQITLIIAENYLTFKTKAKQNRRYLRPFSFLKKRGWGMSF